MQKKINARTVTIMLTLFWLLSSININAYAENIPISEEGIQKIGYNKIRLENGIGVIVFNLSKTGDQLKSAGYLTMSNTYDTSVIMSCDIITVLSPVDLDGNGKPRIHYTISNDTIFKPIPDASWIILEEKNAVINPFSIYNFYYKVNVPFSNDFNSNEGYLVYIHITKEIENATGANIGIDYNYKLFIKFTGEIKQGILFSQWMILLIPIFSIISIVFFYTTKKKHKKTVIKPDIKPIYTKNNAEKTTINHDVEIHQKIDNIIRRKNV